MAGRSKVKPSTYRNRHKVNTSSNTGKSSGGSGSGLGGAAAAVTNAISNLGKQVGSGIKSGAESAGIPISGSKKGSKGSEQSVQRQYRKVMKTASSGTRRRERDRSRLLSDRTAGQVKTAAEQIQERNSRIKTSADYRTQYGEEPYNYRLRKNQERQDREREKANTYHATPEDSFMINYAKSESIIRHHLQREGRKQIEKADKDARSEGKYIPISEKNRYLDSLNEKAKDLAEESAKKQSNKGLKKWNKEDHYRSLGDRIGSIVLGSTEQSIGQYGRFIPEVMTQASSGRAGKSGTVAHRGGVSVKEMADPNRGDKLQAEADRIRRQQRMGSVQAGLAASSLIDKGTNRVDYGMAGLSGGAKFAAEALQGATQLAIDLGIGATGLGMAPMALRAAGGEVDNAMKSGASRKQALLSGAAHGGIEAMTEKISNMGAILQKGFGKGVADDVVDNMLGKIAQKAASQGIKDITHVGGRLLTAAVSEGLEEVIAEATEPALANAIYDAGNATIFSDPQQALSDWARAGALGAVLGGVAGGGGVIGQHAVGSSVRQRGIDDLMAQAVNVDDASDAAAAEGLKAIADSGRALTSLQVEKLNSIVNKQLRSNEGKKMDAVNAASKVMAANGYSGVRDENIILERGKAVSDAARNVVTSQSWGAETEAVHSQAGNIADRMARLETGTARNSDIDTILADPVQRTVYEQITGIELPASASEARDAIYTRSASSLVEMSEVQTKVDRDRAYTKLVTSKERSYGAQGQQAHERFFERAEENGIEMRDADQVADLEKAFEIYYNGGRNDYSYSRLQQMFRNDPRLAGASPTLRSMAFEAGRADSRQERLSRMTGQKRVGDGEPGRLDTSGLSEENQISPEERAVLRDLADVFGIEIRVVDEIENPDGKESKGSGIEGMYNDNVVTLSAGVKRSLLSIFSHEITHHLEDFAPEAWNTLRDYIVDNWAEIGPRMNKDPDLNGMIDAKIQFYQSHGKSLDREGAIKEIIAETPRFFTDVENINNIIKTDRTLGVRILDAIREVLRKIRMILAENSAADTKWLEADLDVMKQAERLWIDALSKAAENKGADVKESGKRFSFVGYSDDGRGVYANNYEKGTQKGEKSRDILDLIQNVWSKSPVSLTVRSGNEERIVEAAFDPYYDETQDTDAGKIAGGNVSGNSSERRVNLNLGPDYYQILSDAEYIESHAEDGEHEESATHVEGQEWHYFINDIYYMESDGGDMEPYSVIINVRENNDGAFVYGFETYKSENLPKALKRKRISMNQGLAWPGKPANIDNSSGYSINETGHDVNDQLSIAEENVGYHAGDLGKSEPRSSMSSDRDTGHFGTGTYFVGDEKKISGDYYGKRPHETVDFDNYNMWKPLLKSDAMKMHDFLRSVNTYWDKADSRFQTLDDVFNAQREGRKIYDEFFDAKSKDLSDAGKSMWEEPSQKVLNEYGEKFKKFYEDTGTERVYEDIVKSNNGGKEFDGNYTEYMIDDLASQIDEKNSDWHSAVDSIRRNIGDDFSTLTRAEHLFRDKSAGEIKKALREVAEDMRNDTTPQNIQDSASTRLMKKLGYEGIDVRGTELDNTTYGSVIYDLKGEDLDRKNEIGTARFSISDEDYMSAVERGDMETAQQMVDEAARKAGLHAMHFFHGTLNATFTIFDKSKAHVGGNSGAGFYFSTEEDDSSRNYSDVEGADNYFKANNLAERILEDGEWQGEDVYDYDRALEIAKEEINKEPGIFDVYLKYDNPYIRNYRHSTDILEDIMDDFDESEIDRDDYDTEDEYEEALVEARDEHVYNRIYDAVYGAVDDLVSVYEEVFTPDIKDIVRSIFTAAVEDDSLTWDDIERCFDYDDISVIPWGGDQVYAGTELTRAIVENLGYDAVEDLEVGTKFNQLMRNGLEDAMHVIVFHPSQIKLSDPVTYDNEHNPIELDQRFNTSNDDIRYSIDEVEDNIRESVGPSAMFGVETDDSGNVRYSIPTEINAHVKGDGRIDTVRKMRERWMDDRKKESKAVNTVLDRIGAFMTDASDLYEYVSLDNVKNATVAYRKDADGNPKSVILSCQVANGEYEVNFDFTTICKKRESFQKVIEDLYKEGVEELDLTEENIFQINQELQKYGFETACPICFVEARRYSNKAYAEKIVNTWNAAVEKINPNAEDFNLANANIDDFDYVEIDRALKNTGIGGGMNFEQKVEAIVRSSEVFQKKLQQSDILTNKGVEALKAMSNKDNSLFGYLKQSRGASAPKEIVAFNAYNGEIELLPKKMKKTPLADYLASIAGARLQSFSDFQIENLYDYMQLIAGMAARKIPCHAYTKEIAFARLFGMTGMKINMSIVCDVDPNVPKEYAGLTYDENGELVYNFGEQTFPWEEAVKLQKDSRYSKNVGTILVGLSDPHIQKALDDPDVRFIIPYHASGLPKDIMASTHLGMATDYTKFQNTCRLNDAGVKALKKAGYESDVAALCEKMGAKKALRYLINAFDKIGLKGSYVNATGEGYGDFDLYGDIQETRNPRKTADNYIEDCMKRGDLPLFFQFAGHKNYYKTLYDFDVYDSVSGRYAPQGPVKNIYPGMDITKGQTDTGELEKIATEYLDEREEIGKKTGGKYADVMTEIKSNVFGMTQEEPVERSQKAESTPQYSIEEPAGEDDVWSWLADNGEDLVGPDDDMSEVPVYDQRINLSRARRDATLEELREAAAWIRKNNETRLTHGQRLDPRSVKEKMNVMIRDLMANSDTSARTKNAAVKQAVAAAQAIYPYLVNEDYDRAADIAYDAALDIIEQIDIVNDEQYMMYSELRDYFRSTKIRIPEKDRSAEYNDLRKKNIGRLRITDAGIELDKIWSEICSDFPGIFDPETNGVDRLAEIDSVLDSFSDFHEEYTSQEMDDLASLTASEIMDIAFNGKPDRTFADKKKEVYDTRTKALKARHREAMAAYREKEKARREKAVKEEREKKKAAVAKEKARGEEKLRQQKEKQKAKDQKRREDAAGKKANEKLERQIAWLSERLLKPTDDKHIPEGYRQAVAQLLAVLDTQTERSRKLEEKYGISKKRFEWLKLKQEYQKIAETESYGFVLDEGLISMMDELSEYLEGRQISDANSEQLDLIRKIVKGIRHGIEYQNKAFSRELKAGTDALGRETMEDTEGRIRKHGRSDGKARADWWFLNESMATPRDYFEGIGSGMNTAFLALRAGMDTHVEDVAYIRDAFTGIFGKYAKKRKPGSELEKWRDDTLSTEFTLESGETVKLNPSQIMSLYCLMKREQAVGHILGSGIIASDVSTKQKMLEKVRGKTKATRGRRVTVTIGDITQIVGTLTEDQREMADKMQDLLNGPIAEWGNETSMRMNGYRKFEEENYFPIQVEKTFLATDFDVTKAPERVKNPGFSKSTVKGASNPIVIDDIFRTVADHCNAMSMYRSFAPAIADFQRIYNYVERDEEGRMTGSVKETLRACYGQHALQYIETFMTDLNGTTPKSKEALTAFVTKSLANYKKAAIGFNMRVALQQPTAIIRAMTLINPKYFAAPKNPKQAVREMKEHCPIALWKSWGFNQVDMARSMEEIMMNQEWSRSDLITMEVYGALDTATWGQIWGAVKREVKAKNPDVEYESQEFWDLCNERASEVFDKTQVVDSVFHRSQVMRSTGALEKLMTSFMAEPTRTFNMVWSQMREAKYLWKDGQKGKATAKANRALSVYIANAALVSMAAAVADALRGKGNDDDDEDKGFSDLYWANFAQNFIDNANPLGLLPIAKDVVSMVEIKWDDEEGLQIERGYGTQFMALEGYEKLFYSFADWTSDKKSLGEKIRGTLEGAGYVFGVPASNIFREFESAMNALGAVFAGEKAEEGGSENFFVKLTDKAKKVYNVKTGGEDEEPEDTEGEAPANKSGKYADIYDEIEQKTAGLSGYERQDKIWEIVTDGYTKLCARGDYESLKKMRKVLKETGGDVAAFDEGVLKWSKSGLKKNIGDTIDYGAVDRITGYLRENGMSAEDISAIYKESDAAKNFQKALQDGDSAAESKYRTQLIGAGMTFTDVNDLTNTAFKRGTGTFQAPIAGNFTITSHFGARSAPTRGASSYHPAIDIGVPTGTSVLAADSGKVIYTGSNGGYGISVGVDHGNGYVTYYNHLSGYGVKRGDYVRKGQEIAKSGSTGVSTGPHLDFKILKDGKAVDPEQYLK